jgi:hypothetical protein
MKLQTILSMLRERKNSTLYVDIPFLNGTHYIQVSRRNLEEILRREFAPDDETGKTLYYNDAHDSLYLEANGSENIPYAVQNQLLQHQH